MGLGEGNGKGIWPVAAALAVCAVGVGLGVSALWKAPPAAQPKFVQRPLSAPQQPPSPRQIAPPSKSLVQASPSDLDALFDIFRENTPPVVKEFAKEFIEEPKLKQAYEEFKEDQQGPDPKQTLATFAQQLGGKAEFRALVSRFSQDPGFRDAALKLTQNSQVSAAVKDIIASARAARAAAGRTGRAAMAGARGAGSASAPQGFAGGSRASAVVARAGGVGPQTETGPSGSGALAGGQAASAVGAVIGAGNAGIGQGPGNGASGHSNFPGPKEQQGSGAHDVDAKLGKFDQNPKNETMDSELRKWLTQHGLDADAFLKATDSGIWDYCFKQQILDKCHAACEDPPKTISTQARGYCTKPASPSPGYPYWNACLQAYDGDELTCIAQCQIQDPCVVDPKYYAKWCIKDVQLGSCTPATTKPYLDALPAACGAKKQIVCKSGAGTTTFPPSKCAGKDLGWAKDRHAQTDRLQSCAGWKPAWVTGKDECESWRMTSGAPGFRADLFNNALSEFRRCGKCNCPNSIK